MGELRENWRGKGLGIIRFIYELISINSHTWIIHFFPPTTIRQSRNTIELFPALAPVPTLPCIPIIQPSPKIMIPHGRLSTTSQSSSASTCVGEIRSVSWRSGEPVCWESRSSDTSQRTLRSSWDNPTIKEAVNQTINTLIHWKRVNYRSFLHLITLSTANKTSLKAWVPNQFWYESGHKNKLEATRAWSQPVATSTTPHYWGKEITQAIPVVPVAWRRS